MKWGKPGTPIGLDKETKPPAKDAKQTAATSSGEAPAPSAAGHSWDPPPDTVGVGDSIPAESEKPPPWVPNITTVDFSVQKRPNEKNPPRATAAEKAAAKAAEKAAAKAAAEAASRKGQASLNFEPPRSAAPAAEKGEDVN